MTQIRIFAAELFDRVSGGPMRLEAWRGPDAADLPFYLDADGSRWAMTAHEASRLSMAAQRVQYRLERAARKNERAKAGAVFRRKLSAPDDETVQAVVELGLVATGEIIAVYFEFAGMRVHLGGEQGAQFLALLVRFGDSVAELHRAQPGGGSFDLLAPPDWGFPRNPG